MTQPFLGQISMFGGTFAPRGWAFCNGQLLPVDQNTSLFSLLGTTYGGNGRTTFALPDLQGRLPMGWGSGPGLSPRTLGQRGGAETVTITGAQLPSHQHHLPVGAEASNDSPTNHVPAITQNAAYGSGRQVRMGTTASAGGNGSHNNLQPSSVIHFIIALQGVFPSRN